MRNDCNECVRLTAIASRPSFELWLLHCEDIQAPTNHDEVMERLGSTHPVTRKARVVHIPNTRDQLEVASQRAQALTEKVNAYTDPEPFTALHELVTLRA